VRAPTVYERMTDSFLHKGSTLTYTANNCPCMDHWGTTDVTSLLVVLLRGNSDLLQSPMGWRECVVRWVRGPQMALAGDRFYAIYGIYTVLHHEKHLSSQYGILVIMAFPLLIASTGSTTRAKLLIVRPKSAAGQSTPTSFSCEISYSSHNVLQLPKRLFMHFMSK